MRTKKSGNTSDIYTYFPPAENRKEQEDQCTCLAYNLVAQRLRDGTATSQETTYFLKVGSTRERYERRIMELQQELLKARTDAINEAKDSRETAERVILAMKRYQGVYDEEVNVL